MNEDPTRPVSVAELLARNGTIGSPPVSGHRRRKRRNAVSVAELTGEIPVIRTGEIPVAVDDEPADTEPESFDEDSADPASETVIVYSSAEVSYAGVDDTPVAAVPDYSDYQDYTPGYDEDLTGGEAGGYVAATGYDETSYDEVAGEVESAPVDSESLPETTYPETEPADPDLPAGIAVSDEVATERRTEPRIRAPRPPLSSIPLPRRRRGPERSHDPRPRRRDTAPESALLRSSGAERMSPDPVDEALDISELVADQVPDPAELRSYLKSSTATLFFGETVADDLARRGEVVDSGYGDSGDYDDASDHDADGGEYERADDSDDGVDAPRRGALSVLGTSLVAVVQSLFAVVFGAGLFIGFDQLWRWNNIVALALSALVIAALMIGVHVVRKTEDFVSTLIAALVGILVTFGPLALQST